MDGQKLMVHPVHSTESSGRADAYPSLTGGSVLQSDFALKRDSICSILLFKGEFTSESYYNVVLFLLS